MPRHPTSASHSWPSKAPHPFLTRAREVALALPPNDRHMRGDGRLSAKASTQARHPSRRRHDHRFPLMPRVADLLPGWQYFTTAEKIEHLIGLDRCDEILSWGPITELDPVRLTFQMQVMRILLRIGLKAALDGTLTREAARERNGSASSKNKRGANSVPVTGHRNRTGKTGGAREGSRESAPC